jgi:hypothetical protein
MVDDLVARRLSMSLPMITLSSRLLRGLSLVMLLPE